MSSSNPSNRHPAVHLRAAFTGLLCLVGSCIAPAVFAADAPATATAPAARQGTGFDILEFDVEGNSRLSESDIEKAVTPFLGEGKSIADVEAASAALEKAYHAAGYLTVLVSVPEQKVDDGVIRLLVVEGQVDRLRVKGAEYHLASRLKESVPQLAEGSVPYFPQVQSEIDGVNRSADLKATPVLKAGRLPGTVDVTLDVEDQLPLHGSLEMNNKQTPFTTPMRVAGSLHYDNLWQRGHSLNLTAQTSPQDTAQAQVLSATYVMPLDSKGNALAAYVVHSSSNVPAYPTSVLGNSDYVGLRYAMPLPATADYSHTLSLGIDHKSIKQTLTLVGGGGTITSDPFDYSPLVAIYNGAWLERGGTTALDATLTSAQRGLFGNSDAAFNAKRSGASADFVAAKIGLRQTQTFGRWTFNARLETQFASGPLVPTEQYAAGGVDTVRGYYESERLGDDALRLAFEGRTPSISFGERFPLRVAGVAFYEGARLRTREPLFPTPDYYRIRGTGLGLRVSGPGGLSMDLDWARALDDGMITKAGDNRLLARLAWDF